MLNDPELLAPAGSFEKLKYALEFGADAVYAGLPDFSLRARINKFNEKNIAEAINYTHSKNKKIYVTINIFAHNYHLNNLKKHLLIFKKNLPDAFIASDIGVIEIIKKVLPKADIHLSTQANTTNWQAAKFWHKQGVKRIVLAREVTLEEIKEIHRKVPKLELEYFVHGAMCMAYSGRCFLSSWQTGRSSNLGDCAQNCRWKYQLVEEKRPNEYMPIEQDNHGTYFLNSKDLCLIEYLDELKNAGITSFKIEGRAKSVYYLAQVVKAYKLALEIKSNDKNKKTKIKKLKSDLNKLVNRTFTTGFLFGECKYKGQETRFSHTEEEYEFVGEVAELESRKLKVESKNFKIIKIKVHNALFVGDRIEFIQPRGKNIFCKIKNIYDDKTLAKLKSAHGGQERMVYIEISKMVEVFSVIRKRKNKE
ncbi:U32 family peptidase C-terminal domain-containing protein [Candidatus Parcubacteria bacterium]|nr:U32 family peptidase C-terminal domain-containing protein [Candidatus Parcubacteria bacterium]